MSRARPMTEGSPAPRRQLLDVYASLLAATDAGEALTAALEANPPSLDRSVHILAIGKAASSMARSAVRWLAAREHAPVGGLVVGLRADAPPHAALASAAGGHPVPDEASRAAAALLRRAVSSVNAEESVWLLLSGGASSLIAAPIPGVALNDLAVLYDLLLASGLDIAGINAIRKRFTVWGGGRLAAALAPSRVEQFLVSDVPGDDPSVIGSGPAAPDPTSITEVLALLARAALFERLPPTVAEALSTRTHRAAVATVPPGDPAFRSVTTRIVASNRTALRAGAQAVEALGYHARIVDEPLAGDAAAAGVMVAHTAAAGGDVDVPAALLWGGEPTVVLPPGAPPGGRCQELALAASKELARHRGGPRVTVLAAGTDGRDGPTDAAGAIIGPATWTAIVRAGRNPEADLRNHRAHDALAAVDALIPRRMTGTNMMDVVVALREPVGSAGLV